MRGVVAFDANPAARETVTGTELVARELALRLPGLAPEIDWIFYSARPSAELPLDLTVLPMPRLWSQLRLPLELRARRPDLLFVPSHVVPFLTRVPALTIVHDLAFERFPDAYSAGARRYLRLTTRWAQRRCRRLIAVSESTKSDLVELYGIDPARIVVAYPGGGEPASELQSEGPDDEARLTALGVTGPYVLQVGRIERRKNQVSALAAVEAVPGLTLVCAGAVHDESIAARLRSSGRCQLLGRVGVQDLASLYRGAVALIVPSLYEGFGFPILEAMRNGVPVLTVRRSSLPELGGDAVLYVDDPSDSRALAAALIRLRGEPLRSQLIAAGRARAGEFTWDRFAGTVAEVIRGLLDAGSPGPARSGPPTSPR